MIGYAWSLVGALVFASAEEAPEAIFVEDASVFSCSPSVVGPNDEIVLRKSDERFDELAVHRVGERVGYSLVIDSPPGAMTSLMSTIELSKAHEVRISVATLSGYRWAADPAQERVFSQDGTYEFALSPTFESDEGGVTCSVRFESR